MTSWNHKFLKYIKKTQKIICITYIMITAKNILPQIFKEKDYFYQF